MCLDCRRKTKLVAWPMVNYKEIMRERIINSSGKLRSSALKCKRNSRGRKSETSSKNRCTVARNVFSAQLKHNTNQLEAQFPAVCWWQQQTEEKLWGMTGASTWLSRPCLSNFKVASACTGRACHQAWAFLGSEDTTHGNVLVEKQAPPQKPRIATPDTLVGMIFRDMAAHYHLVRKITGNYCTISDGASSAKNAACFLFWWGWIKRTWCFKMRQMGVPKRMPPAVQSLYRQNVKHEDSHDVQHPVCAPSIWANVQEGKRTGTSA